MQKHAARDGAFRWRGDGVSRIEGLSDAVFGFAVTLLVVSLEVPRTFDDLAQLLLGLPAFAATFTLLVLVWFAQYRFFRRYGLEDGRTMVLNVALLFVVLFYIYPLKFLFQTFIGLSLALVGYAMEVPWLRAFGQQHLHALEPAQWPILTCVYAIGWVAMYCLLEMMHRHALRCAESLELDAVEILLTRAVIAEQRIMIVVGLASAVVTLLLAYVVGVHPWLAAGLGGWVYFFIWPSQVVIARRFARERAALAPASGAPVEDRA